jgi:ubiquinone biosynthesis protein
VGHLQSIQRSGKIAQVLLRHGLLGLADALGLAGGGSAPPLRAAKLGRRLAQALDELGPTFVKLGQVLATREDLLPAEMIRELATLQDSATPIPAHRAREQVRRALGAPVAALYAAFDDRPLAAGSIAQIHRARTRDGAEVVVKVRRPGIETTIEQDVALLRSLAARLETRVPELARHDPVGFVDEFARALRAELDFEREARSLERMRRSLGRTARIPRVHAELSADAVLTMDFVAGVKVSKVAPEARERLAHRLVACFATQYLRGDLFHADPHAGNLLLAGDGALCMLDLGAVGAINGEMRRNLLQLASAAGQRNGTLIASAVLPMVHVPAELDRGAYEADMGRLIAPLVRGAIGDIDATALVRDVFGVAQRHGLRFRAEYFLLFRSAMLVDGVIRSLHPAIDPIKITRAHIIRSFWRPAWLAPALWLGYRELRARLARALGTRVRLALAATAATAAALALVASTTGDAAPRPSFGGDALAESASPLGGADESGDEPAVVPRTSSPAPTLTVGRDCAVRSEPRRGAARVAQLRAGELVVAAGETRYFWRLDEPAAGYVAKACARAAATPP